MSCEPYYYSGLSDCDALFKDVIGVCVLNKKQTLSSPEALATYTAIFAGTSAQTGIYLPISRGYQNNTAEPELTTSQVGFTEKTSDPLPALVGFLNKSYCDYKTLWGLDNAEKDLVFVLKNGYIWHTRNSENAVGGFRAKLNTRRNAPSADNSQEAFPIYMNFKYIDDFDEAGVTKLSFTIKEFEDVVPVGLGMKLVTAYTAGDITVDIMLRCTTSPFADITDETSFEILYTEPGSTDLDIDVTAVDKTSAAIGRYILTVKKDASTTPADLTKGVWIRAIEDDGTKVTYVSAPFFVKV